MRILLLLMLMVLLPNGLVSAAPARTSPHAPGDLAKDRLQEFADLFGPPDRVLLVQPDQSRAVLSEAQAKIVVSLLRDLVLDDALYFKDAPHEQGKVTESVTLEKGGSPSLTVSINRDQPSLNIYQSYGSRSVTANYLPVLPKVIRLLQALDPRDKSLATFRPFSLPPTPVAKGIPASALARIATIKPGMTRADVLHVFTTEGGLSSTYWNHYVYRAFGHPKVGQQNGLLWVNGKLIKVNIDFAPRDADIVWFNGSGFWLHQSEYRSHPIPTDSGEHPDDIILRVTAPYLEGSIDN